MTSRRFQLTLVVALVACVVLVVSALDRDGTARAQRDLDTDSGTRPAAGNHADTLPDGNEDASRHDQGPGVVGRVVDAVTGESIEGAEVTVEGVEGTLARSDSTGGFLSRPPGQGPHTLVARRDGYAESRRTGVYAGTTVTIALVPAVDLVVRVVDEAGNPVASCRVVARGRPSSNPWENVRTHALTSDKGTASLTCPPGPYQIGAIPPANRADLTIAELSRELAPGRREIELVCPRGVSMRGRVVDAATREPVPKAKVVLLLWRWEERSAIADEQGCFEITGARPGLGSLARVSAPGYSTATQQVFSGSGEPVELLAFRPLRAKVIVRDEMNRAVPGATVSIYGWLRRPGTIVAESTTDGTGECEFKDLSGEPGAKFHAVARSPAGDILGVSPVLAVLLRKKPEVVIEASRAGVPVEILVRRNGQPLEGRRVHLGLLSGFESRVKRTGATTAKYAYLPGEIAHTIQHVHTDARGVARFGWRRNGAYGCMVDGHRDNIWIVEVPRDGDPLRFTIDITD